MSPEEQFERDLDVGIDRVRALLSSKIDQTLSEMRERIASNPDRFAVVRRLLANPHRFIQVSSVVAK